MEALPDVGPRRGNRAWTNMQSKLASEMQHQRSTGQCYEFLFYGDSITETWRGTNMDKPAARARGGPQQLLTYWSKNSTGVFAISGDRTGHLLWRLQHGEMPSGGCQPKAAVLLIGTNDLGSVARLKPDADMMLTVEVAEKRLCAIVGLLKTQLNKTHVVVAALLPRGSFVAEQNTWPNEFSKAIVAFNTKMADASRNQPGVSFIDCSHGFYTSSQTAIRKDLMPDCLHPNIKGMSILAECYRAELKRLYLM